MSEVSTDKKLKGKDLITIGIFSAIYFVINFAFMLLGRKGSKTGCSFPDGAYHCSYLFCHWTIYPCNPDLDGFYLHFGRSCPSGD